MFGYKQINSPQKVLCVFEHIRIKNIHTNKKSRVYVSMYEYFLRVKTNEAVFDESTVN